MSFPAWIVLGLIAGFVGSRIINRTGEGKLLDILLGVVGAVLAGWLFNIYGMPGVTGFQVNSLVVSVIGAVGLLVIYHLFFRCALLASPLPTKQSDRPSSATIKPSSAGCGLALVTSSVVTSIPFFVSFETVVVHLGASGRLPDRLPEVLNDEADRP